MGRTRRSTAEDRAGRGTWLVGHVLWVITCGGEPGPASAAVVVPAEVAAPEVATPVVVPAVATPVAAPVVAPAPAASVCATVEVAARWKPPVSRGRGTSIVPEPRLTWRGQRANRPIRETLARRCPGQPPSTYGWEDDPEYPDDSGAWRGEDELILYSFDIGQGVEASHGAVIRRYDLQRCTSAELSMSWSDDGLSGFVDPGASPELLRAVIGPQRDGTRPSHAYATLLATDDDTCTPDEVPEWHEPSPRVAGAPSFELLGLPFTEQPWFPGRPVAQERVWQQLTPDEPDDPAQRVFEVPRPPKSLRTVGDFEIFGAVLPGRNGGFALAVYDRAGDRHRWSLVTRGCLYGTEIHWLAQGSGVIVGYALSQHPIYQEAGRDGLFALDLASARAYRLLLAGSHVAWELPGPVAEDIEDTGWISPAPATIGRFRVDQQTLRTRCGGRVTMAELHAAIAGGATTPGPPGPAPSTRQFDAASSLQHVERIERLWPIVPALLRALAPR